MRKYLHMAINAKTLIEKYPDARWLYNQLNGVYADYETLFVIQNIEYGHQLIVPNTHLPNHRKAWRILEKVESKYHDIHYKKVMW